MIALQRWLPVTIFFNLKSKSMKRTFAKFAGKKFITAAIISASLLASAPITALANQNRNIEIISNENTASVKYTGSADDAFFFDVKVNNPKGDKFTLLITSDDGEVLFSKDYTDTSFTKRIKILKSEYMDGYNISIRSSNKDLENYFSVNTVSKTVEDVVVTKL
jgi:hypothetical protein